MASIYIGPYVLCARPTRKEIMKRLGGDCPNGHISPLPFPYCPQCGAVLYVHQEIVVKPIDVLRNKAVDDVFHLHTFDLHDTEYVAYMDKNTDVVWANSYDGVYFDADTRNINPDIVKADIAAMENDRAALITLMREHYGNAAVHYGVVFVPDRD